MKYKTKIICDIYSSNLENDINKYLEDIGQWELHDIKFASSKEFRYALIILKMSEPANIGQPGINQLDSGCPLNRMNCDA